MLERIGAEHVRAAHTILYSCWLYSTTSMGSVRFDRFAECSSFPCAWCLVACSCAPQQAACFTLALLPPFCSSTILFVVPY